MNRFFPILLLAILASSVTHAAVTKTPVDKVRLEKTLKFYRGISVLKVSFKEVKTLQNLSLKLYSEGNLTVKPPDRVIWEVTKPSPLKVSLEQKAVEIVSGTGTAKQTQSFSMQDGGGEKGAQALAHLAAWLKLDADALSEQYQIFALEKDTFEFQPKKQDSSPFKSITMKMGPSGHLQRLQLLEISNDTIRIDFAKPTIERANAKK